MSDSYKYVDLDFIYTDPKTGILRNLADITDPDVLLFFESGAVTKRIQELYDKPVKIKGADSLLSIHRHLFQDVYSWAGERRKVEISKEGKQFFPTTYFDNAFRFIDTLISDYKNISKGDKLKIAEKLAEICHGKLCIRGMRWPVEVINDMLGSGMAIDQILDDHRELEKEDVLASLNFAK